MERTVSLRIYYGVGGKEAKGALNRIVYGGGCPEGDAPFLHILRFEDKAAAEYLTGPKLHVGLNEYYEERRRPLYGHLEDIISFQEDDALKTTMRSFTSDPTCLMFDGDILRCDDISCLDRTRRERRADAGGVGLGVAAQQRGRLPLREEDWTSSTWIRTPHEIAASKLGAISKVHGAKKCLYNEVRGMQVPNSYEVPATDGPYSVQDYNVNATHWLVRNARGDHRNT